MFPVSRSAEIVGGRLRRGTDEVPRRVVHDSRLVQEGDLFVALRGERTDGHCFLGEAFSRGACGAIVSDVSSVPKTARNIIVVNDSFLALKALANAWRKELPAVFVGVTGTCGKTTTKALLAHLLAEDRKVYASPESYNTEIGLSLALLAMPISAQVGVFELGTSAPGEIAPLAALLSPRLAILTMVGRGHLAGFGSSEGIAAEKWELVRSLPPQGLAIINADSPAIAERARVWEGDLISFGLKGGGVRGRIVDARHGLILDVEEPPLHLVSSLLGRHHASNLLAAAVGALRLGVASETIERRVATFSGLPHRLNLSFASFGYLLDDSYNANPDSTKAALHTLAELDLPVDHRAFVFGDMLELGEDAPRFHREVLDLAVQLGISPIFPVGELAVRVAREAANELGSGILVFATWEELPRRIRQAFRGNQGALLVKGSRRLGLERLVETLKDTAS
jgi:UDP-N-acetylmuramoyl-tripeptide--D-alanyl-D-alanine ligase